LRHFWFMNQAPEGEHPLLLHLCGDVGCVRETPTDDHLVRVLDGGEHAQWAREVLPDGRRILRQKISRYRPCAMIVPAPHVLDLLPVVRQHLSAAAQYPSVVVLLVDETVELEAVAPLIQSLRLHLFPSFAHARPTWAAELLPKVSVEDQQKLHRTLQRSPEVETCVTFMHDFEPWSQTHYHGLSPFIQKECTRQIRERTHPEPGGYSLAPRPFDEEAFEAWLTPTCGALTKPAARCG